VFRFGTAWNRTAASLGCMSIDATDFDIGSLRDQLKLLADYL
jgi:hypothetical protein